MVSRLRFWARLDAAGLGRGRLCGFRWKVLCGGLRIAGASLVDFLVCEAEVEPSRPASELYEVATHAAAVPEMVAELNHGSGLKELRAGGPRARKDHQDYRARMPVV